MARIHQRTVPKSPNDPDKPDILECEVKWTLGSIITNKTSGGDGIPAELFQILNDDAVKVFVALNMPANLENSAVATRLEKISFHFQCQRKTMSKNAQTTAQLHLFHTLVK